MAPKQLGTWVRYINSGLEEGEVNKRKNCQNVITKLDYQFMDLTDKGLFLMSVKNPVKLDLLFRVSSLKTKNVFLTVTKLITFFGITPILFLLSECHH